MALTRLEGTSWYQAKDLVDDYIDHFQELIDLGEYDDDKTIIIKFQHGPDLALQNQVALLGDGAPNFDDPKGWYEAACKVSWSREANEAFVEMNQNVMCNSVCSVPPLPKSKVVFSPMLKMLPSLTLPTPVQCPSPPPLKNGPAPMNIDCMCGRGNPGVTCFHCQQPGHYAHECPQAFDIQSMTMEEKLELLPEFLALVDVSEVPPTENGDREAEYDAPEVEETSDFVTHSK